MLVNIIMFGISLIIIGILFFITLKAVNKANSLIEKLVYISIFVLVVAIFVTYYLDRYNIPTYFLLVRNVNSQNWLSLVGNYISGIVSAIIGGLVVVWSTMYQVKKNSEDNEKRNMESLRLQNLPIIKYDINTEARGKGDLEELILTNKEHESGEVYCLNIILKNIGMNTIKNTILDFKSELVNNAVCRLLGKEAICPIEKGEVIEINRYFSLSPSPKDYEMNLTIYYQDVFSNWYKQEILIHYSASEVFKEGRNIGRISYNVKEESRINVDEIEKYNI